MPRVLAEALHKAAPQYAKRVWLEADHFFNGVDRQVECNHVIEWVVENLPKKK